MYKFFKERYLLCLLTNTAKPVHSKTIDVYVTLYKIYCEILIRQEIHVGTDF